MFYSADAASSNFPAIAPLPCLLSQVAPSTRTQQVAARTAGVTAGWRPERDRLPVLHNATRLFCVIQV